MVKASDEKMEELKDFFDTSKPFYFIEKVLD